MSRLLGKELTPALFDRLKGENVASQAGKAVILVTVDEGGWPHPAMLSYHEVVAKNPSMVDLAIGKTSTTARNARRTGKITVLVTDRGVNYYLKGSAREHRESLEGVPVMSLFRVEMAEILEDQEPDAMITSGVTFDRPRKKGAGEIAEKIFQAVRRGA